MTTIGQQVLDRLEAVEASMAELNNQATMPRPPTSPALLSEMEALRKQFREEVERARDMMGFGTNTTANFRKSLINPKDCLPGVLSSDYKNKWRTWAYKARDFLGQLDYTLPNKLLKLESQTTEITEE